MVAQEVIHVERIIPPRFVTHPPENAAEAWRIVNRPHMVPIVTEDPLFRTLYGYVASSCIPPRLSEAREAFAYAIQMKFEPDIRYLNTWFTAERNSGVFDEWCEKVADIVISGKRYTESEKIMMVSRKAVNIYTRGSYKLTMDSVDAIECFRESLKLHLKAFRLNCLAGTVYADSSENYARNTIFTLFNVLKTSPWEQISVIRSLLDSKDIYLDPIEDAVREYATITLPSIKRDDLASRTRQRLKGLPEVLAHNDLWLSSSCQQRVVHLIREAEKILAEKSKK